ncbi:MAG: hypothetical protein ACREHG_02390 [Candidatus Saccharimonadales bacterium]
MYNTEGNTKTKMHYRKLKAVLFTFTLALCTLNWSSYSLAATGTIYLSPSSTSVVDGNSFTEALRINPGTSVNAVQATVDYNAGALQFDSDSIGAFSTCTQNSGGGGSVTLACAMLGGSTSSDSLIANITFTALISSGSSSLSISNANAADNGTYTDPGSSGATAYFSAPASSSPPSGSSGPSGGSGSGGGTYYHHSYSSSSTSSTPTTSGSTPATSSSSPQSSALATKVTLSVLTDRIQFTNAKFTALSNVPIQTYAEYGLSPKNLSVSTPLSTSSKSSIIDLGNPGLIPGTTYYYKIVAKNSSGAVVASTPIEQFKTRGYQVSVTVLDKNYHPLSGKTVYLHSTPMETTTNSKGIAIFNDVSPGLHHLQYSVGSHTYSQSVYVTDNLVTTGGLQSAAPRSSAVILSGYVASASAVWPLVLVVSLLVVAIAAGLFWGYKYRLLIAMRIRHLRYRWTRLHHTDLKPHSV